MATGVVVFTWGCGSDGRLGHPEAHGHRYLFHSNVPRQVDGLEFMINECRPAHQPFMGVPTCTCSNMEDSEEVDITLLSNEKLEEDVEKGRGIKHQLALWDGMLEGRIKLQKSLTLCNQLPQPDTVSLYSNSPNIEPNVQNCQNSLQKLLDDLVDLQDILDHKRSDSRPITSGPYRDEILEKWSTKLELATGKLTMKSYAHQRHSLLATIDHILKDRKRLKRRTQLKRAQFKILGKAVSCSSNDKEKMDEAEHDLHLKDIDEEIFDDNDFYHQLLKELISSKTLLNEEEDDPVTMGRKWLELQTLKSKIKKSVDTKASKGRRLRYHTHQKLIGFMAPINIGTYSEVARNDLFSSLFDSRSLHY